MNDSLLLGNYYGIAVEVVTVVLAMSNTGVDVLMYTD